VPNLLVRESDVERHRGEALVHRPEEEEKPLDGVGARWGEIRARMMLLMGIMMMTN